MYAALLWSARFPQEKNFSTSSITQGVNVKLGQREERHPGEKKAVPVGLRPVATVCQSP
jgi:hypothetical protein